MPAAHKSAISVGLLYIPVGLYKTTKETGIAFNQLCKDTHERVKYKKYCPSCNKEISNDDIIKGYEYEKGHYVTFTPDELEKIKSTRDKTIHIVHFAKMSEIDPLLFDRDYYLAAESGAEKAYELLRQSLLSQKTVGVAKTVLGTNEELLVLYPTKECIVAKILHYQEEIQELPKSSRTEISKEELAMAKTLISSMTRKFDISEYHDEYQERLRNAITSKIHGNEILSADTTGTPGNVIDLMEALQKSVALAKNGKASA